MTSGQWEFALTTDGATHISKHCVTPIETGSANGALESARAHALNFTWEASAQQFLDNVRAARGIALQWPSGKQPKFFRQRQVIQPR